MEAATEDDVIRKNPCRIRGAGREEADERPVATVAHVFALADVIGPRWRLMVLLGAFASMRPEELAELRRGDVDLDAGSVWVRRAAPELNTGHRVVGDPKSRAGKREIVLLAFVHVDVRRHLDWFAQPGPDGLVFVGERAGSCGAPLSAASGARHATRSACPKTSASTTYGTLATPSPPTPVPCSRTSWSESGSRPSAHN